MEKTKFLDECKKIIFKNIELFQILEEYDKTHRLKKVTYKQRVNFTIDAEIIKKFREYCRKKGTKMSTELEKCIANKIQNL